MTGRIPERLRAEYERVRAEPCRCVMCDCCNGKGEIRFPANNQFVEDETEPCDACSGGVADVCDRCRLLEEMEHDEALR